MPPAKRHLSCSFMGRVMTALQTVANGQPPADPAQSNTPAGRHICLPYKHPVSRTQPQKRCRRADGHGPQPCGPYEPTGKAGEWAKQKFAADRPRRGQKYGPYNSRETTGKPCTGGGQTSTAGSAPADAFRRPTAAQRRLLGRRSRPRPAFPFLSGRRPRNTIIFHFSFFIFNF